MRIPSHTVPAVALLLAAWTNAPAAFSLHDVQVWAGAADPSSSRAVLVIDWDDGAPPLAWGFRWGAADSPSGADLLRSVVAADPRLHIAGLDTGFVSHFSFDADLDGQPERFRPGWDGVSRFWNYFVNNAVWFDPEDFTRNGHAVPPATAVLPLGNPYDPEAPAPWIASSTGVLERPLADGSWDGFFYGDGSVTPGEPAAAPRIPEPAPAGFLLLAAAWLVRRRRTDLRRHLPDHAPSS